MDGISKWSGKLVQKISGSVSGTSQASSAVVDKADEAKDEAGVIDGRNGVLHVPKRLFDPADDLTRFAFLDLITSVFRTDFINRACDTPDRLFCEATFELILKRAGFSDKTKETLRSHLRGDGCHDDVISLIVTIKKNAVLKTNGGPAVLIADLVPLFVQTGVYDCRYRVLLRHLCALLGLCFVDTVEDVEAGLVHLLVETEYEQTEAEKDTRRRKEKLRKIKRYAMIGASGAVGGVLIGVTGGLAAPLVAAGAGVVVGAGAAAGIATTAGAAVLGSVFGGLGAGLTGYKMKKRVGAIEEFTIETLCDGKSLHCVIAVCGWIKDEREDAFRYPWRHLNISTEQYSLRYESEYLLQLGKGMDYLMSVAVSYAVQQTLMETALAGLVSAIAWPVAVLSVASVLDNPWSVCARRSVEVGVQLAEVLLSRQQGQRPVSLVGYSLGARVIFHCLLEMSNRANSRGIVEDVYLLGAPVAGSPRDWCQLCRVVGGRLVNGYSTSDWLLRFLYRTMNVQFSIAGTAPVERTGERKIVNVNLSHIVSGHLDYDRKLTEVLAAVGVTVTAPSSTHTSSPNLAALSSNSGSAPSLWRATSGSSATSFMIPDTPSKSTTSSG